MKGPFAFLTFRRTETENVLSKFKETLKSVIIKTAFKGQTDKVKILAEILL